MKQLIVLIATFALFATGCSPPVDTIKEKARQASVQTVFHVPVIRASFTTPLPEKDVVNTVKLNESLKTLKVDLEAKIKELLDENNKLLREDRFEGFLTDIDVYGITPPSNTMIPLGVLITDEEYRFPEKVIVVCKTEKKDIKEWEKEFEKDVLAISETANVSPTKAKEILSRLRSDGYSVSREEIAKSSDVSLLWFPYGWAKSSRTLNWKVEIEGTEENIIVGYDPRGILETRPIPDKKRVRVVAGYLRLKDKFREKSLEIKNLEDKVKSLQDDIKNLEKSLEEKQKELDKKEDKKRDITKATMWDVAMGNVKLEFFWYATAASGTYIGDMAIRKDMGSYGAWRGMGYFEHNVMSQRASVILTNAHVAAIATDFNLYVSKDTEIMFLQFPGYPYVRYTTTSDYFGSPASVLGVDEQPLVAHDIDTGIMITTPVSSMKSFTPVLGDSNRVNEGDGVVMVGNPSLLQKFTTQGVIANKDYSVLDGLMYQYAGKYLDNNPLLYRWLKNSKFWFDTPIGTGGTSGSGVWALSGKEQGNLIAIHNMGIGNSCSTVTVDPNMTELKLKSGYSDEYTNDIKKYTRKHLNDLVDLQSHKKAVYSASLKSFIEKDETFGGLINKTRCHVDIPGLNAGIPINLVKQFLEERGVQIGIKPLPETHFIN